jgi:DNA-binding NarL/FixJ family response regulator
MSKKIDVIIVDDHKIFRDGFKLLLKDIEHINIVGEAENGKEFIELIEKVKPTLVFMDVNMPVLDGIEATKMAVQKNHDMKIIALSTFDNIELVNEMIFSGVDGYLLKNANYKEIKEAIIRVMQGDNYFSNKVLYNLAKNSYKKKNIQESVAEKYSITHREIEILELLCNGYSKHEIANRLFISEYTVEKHKSNLFEKTNVKNVVTLVVFALKNKIVDFHEN